MSDLLLSIFLLPHSTSGWQENTMCCPNRKLILPNNSHRPTTGQRVEGNRYEPKRGLRPH